MSGIDDDQIRAALARRSRVALTENDRVIILRAARLEALQPRRRLMPRVAGWFAAAVAAVVLVVIAAPVLLSSPVPVARASSSPAPKSTVPAVAVSPSLEPLPVYTAQQLSDMIGDPARIGATVLAEASITPLVGPDTKQCPPPDQPCGALQGVTGSYLIHLGWRDANSGDGVHSDEGDGYRWIKPVSLPSGSGVFAFEIGSFYAELLGPATLGTGGLPLNLVDVPRESEKTPTDNVYVVSGWWYSGFWPLCPEQALETPPPELDYYCEGSWITPSEPQGNQMTTAIDGSLELPAGPYPSWSDQHSPGRPVKGIYVVRSAGCQIVLEPNCPVWRLLGRLDSPPNPAPTSEPPLSPSPTVQASASVEPATQAAIFQAAAKWLPQTDIAWIYATAGQNLSWDNFPHVTAEPVESPLFGSSITPETLAALSETFPGITIATDLTTLRADPSALECSDYGGPAVLHFTAPRPLVGAPDSYVVEVNVDGGCQGQIYDLAVSAAPDGYSVDLLLQRDWVV